MTVVVRGEARGERFRVSGATPADDLTIPLEPKHRILRKIVEILDKFKEISGLNISVSKTKAVWFGQNWNSDEKLCPDLQLKWVKNFKLLGINFNNNLNDIEQNFANKIEETSWG